MKRRVRSMPAFERGVKKYVRKHPESAASIADVLLRLGADASDPRLKTHPLKGPLAGQWACSGGYDLRLLFEIVNEDDEEVIVLLAIGTHEEVY